MYLAVHDSISLCQVHGARVEQPSHSVQRVYWWMGPDSRRMPMGVMTAAIHGQSTIVRFTATDRSSLRLGVSILSRGLLFEALDAFDPCSCILALCLRVFGSQLSGFRLSWTARYVSLFLESPLMADRTGSQAPVSPQYVSVSFTR